ncbi:MAG: tryptophan--tRNA ligase [Flavobacteriales bacterium]
MARILTGIQSTGTPHLGNILGAIRPAIDLSNDDTHEAFLFIADLHSLTTIRDGSERIENTRQVAAAWLACGFDSSKNLFYKQSDLPEVCELTWYLSCFAPYGLLQKAHSFKDHRERNEEVNSGLFTYPVLMAADILLYEAEKVPVGKDQKQHLEMARDIAQKLNNQYGESLLTIPEPMIDEEVMTIPGTDGRKMSKSYGNGIDLFTSDKELKKQVMSIVTDTKGLDDPKDPQACNVFALYEKVAAEEKVQEMAHAYRKGGYGYGDAKKALLNELKESYGEAREAYAELMRDPERLEGELYKGAERARPIAQRTLGRLREIMGFKLLPRTMTQ